MFGEAIHKSHERGVPWLYVGSEFGNGVDFQRVRLAVALGQYARDGQHWHGKGGFVQKWPSWDQAYDMEQRVLASFADTAKFGERVHCTREELDAAWQAAWKG